MGHDISRGERRVTAQLDLDGRRKPAQQVILSLGYKECGLGEVVLGGDRLHRRFREPFGERAHGRRIAAEEPAGERVDLVERDAHGGLRVARNAWRTRESTSERLNPTSRSMRSSSSWSKYRLRARSRQATIRLSRFGSNRCRPAGPRTLDSRYAGKRQLVSIQSRWAIRVTSFIQGLGVARLTRNDSSIINLS